MTSPATPPPPPTPELTFLYTLHCKVQNALYTAEVPWGTRAVLPITGGNFSGPRLKGEVLDLGADWGLTDPTNSIFHADTRYGLRTSSDDGEEPTYTYVRTSGPSQPEGGLHLRGVFETGRGKYWWLNFVVAIGKTQTIATYEGGFTLRIDMWYMASPNDQLTNPAIAEQGAKL